MDENQELEKSGSTWENLMYICLLAAGHCAMEADVDADEFMHIVRSIRVTDEGVHGDC